MVIGMSAPIEEHVPFNLGDLLNPSGDPADLAVIDLHDPQAPRHVSHGDIDAQARAVARLLHGRGLRAGQRVGILSGNRAEYLSIYSGIARAGLVAVPLNNKAPADLIGYVAEDAELALVFVDAQQASKVPVSVPSIGLDDDGPQGFQAQLDHGSFDTVRPGSDDVAEVLYTSGSSGRPKGVPLTHAGQLWMADRRGLAPDSGQVAIIAQPLFHMAGLLVGKRVLREHGTAVILARFDAREYLHVLARYGVTHVQAVPTVLARLVREADLLASLDLSALRVISLGSAPMTRTLFDKVEAAFPHAKLTHGYGSTEAGGGLFGPHPAGLPTPPISVGVPLDGIEIRLREGPDDSYGVMQVRSPGVTRGYLNLPERNASAFDGDWYITGDVMRRDSDGFYFFVGRADDMFVCGGENIYPGDVEKTLEKHPDVHQACVVPLPDEDRGQIPVAFVVGVPGSTLDAKALRQFAVDNGPVYQYPRRVAFVSELPLAGTDKIDRQAVLRAATEREAAQQLAW